MYYAQINEDCIVTGVSQLAALVKQGDMIEIPELDQSLLGMKYDSATKKFSTPASPPPVETPVEKAKKGIKDIDLEILDNDDKGKALKAIMIAMQILE